MSNIFLHTLWEIRCYVRCYVNYNVIDTILKENDLFKENLTFPDKVILISQLEGIRGNLSEEETNYVNSYIFPYLIQNYVTDIEYQNEKGFNKMLKFANVESNIEFEDEIYTLDKERDLYLNNIDGKHFNLLVALQNMDNFYKDPDEPNVDLDDLKNWYPQKRAHIISALGGEYEKFKINLEFFDQKIQTVENSTCRRDASHTYLAFNASKFFDIYYPEIKDILNEVRSPFLDMRIIYNDLNISNFWILNGN